MGLQRIVNHDLRRVSGSAKVFCDPSASVSVIRNSSIRTNLPSTVSPEGSVTAAVTVRQWRRSFRLLLARAASEPGVLQPLRIRDSVGNVAEIACGRMTAAALVAK